MSVDLSTTIAAKSDQLNADDLIAGPKTGRVLSVRDGTSKEQPVWIDLDCWPQPYKPCKTMRRVLCDVWGTKGADYVGRTMRVFRNPDVKYGGEKVGGIEISHVSNIEGKREISLTVSRGKKRTFVIQPLTQPATPQPSPMEAMKARWKEVATDKTADAFRAFVSEATAGQIGMADAMSPSKYTPELLERCEAAIKELGNVAH